MQNNLLTNSLTGYMYGLVKRVIDEIGPRPSCSEEEKRLGRLLVEEWKPVCDRVDVEDFTCSPSAFLGFIPIAVPFYLASIISYWFLPPLSLALATVGFSTVFFEFLRYREFVDFLFPRKRGENVIGVIQPKSKPVRRVIVSAHMDSAYEFNFIYYFKNAAILIIVIAVVGVFLAFAGSLAKTVAYVIGFESARAFTGIGITLISVTPIVGLFLFFHSRRPVPGAMDDMAGIAVVVGLGKYLDEVRRSGNRFADKTEVMLVATSSEEAGLRGAKRYVRRHLKEMKSMPTYGIFLDGIYDEKFLTVTNREICTGARHDPQLISMVKDIAKSHKWPLAVRWIPIGGTDASAFSVKGIPAICLHCQDTSKAVPNYHTRNDTYEYVRPESLTVSLSLVVDMIERIDKM